MAQDTTNPEYHWSLWLRLPLIPIILLIGGAVVLLLVIIYLICIPYFMLYPECARHSYDFGDERKQEAVRRWRRRCSRVSLCMRIRRLAQLVGVFPRNRSVA